MSSYEDSSLTEIEAVLDGLTNATPEQVYDATLQYSSRAVAAAAASRADSGGGGGVAGANIESWTYTAAAIAARWDAAVAQSYMEVPGFGVGDICFGLFTVSTLDIVSTSAAFYFLPPGRTTAQVNAESNVSSNFAPSPLDEGSNAAVYRQVFDLTIIKQACSGYFGVDASPTTGMLTFRAVVRRAA